MIRLSQVKQFEVVPEGKNGFYIYDVEYNTEFQVLKIKCEAETGHFHCNTYRFLANPRSIDAFSTLARAVYNNAEVEDIDPYDLIGRYFTADVSHTKSADGEKTFVSMKYPKPLVSFVGNRMPKKFEFTPNMFNADGTIKPEFDRENQPNYADYLKKQENSIEMVDNGEVVF